MNMLFKSFVMAAILLLLSSAPLACMEHDQRPSSPEVPWPTVTFNDANSADLIPLNNGTRHPRVSVYITMIALQEALNERPWAVRALARKCCDPKYEIDDCSLRFLQGYRLVEKAQVPPWVKAVLCSSVNMEGDKIWLEDPQLRDKPR